MMMAEQTEQKAEQPPAENAPKTDQKPPETVVAEVPKIAELPLPPPPAAQLPPPPAPAVLPPPPTPAALPPPPAQQAPAQVMPPTPQAPAQVAPPAPQAPALVELPAAPATAPALPEGTEEAPAEPEKPARKFNLPLLFGRYTFEGVEVHDPGLKRYINITPIALPHTNARYSSRPFSKQKVNIVERLVNGMMRTEHATGEKARTYRMVRDAFKMIEEKTKLNPIQVLVDAVEKASPREEVTRLKYGGISVPKAVDTSSYRRVNIAIKNLCQGVVKSSRGNKKRIEQVLADELAAAARGDVNSFAISKKGEIERVAASAR